MVQFFNQSLNSSSNEVFTPLKKEEKKAAKAFSKTQSFFEATLGDFIFVNPRRLSKSLTVSHPKKILKEYEGKLGRSTPEVHNLSSTNSDLQWREELPASNLEGEKIPFETSSEAINEETKDNFPEKQEVLEVWKTVTPEEQIEKIFQLEMFFGNLGVTYIYPKIGNFITNCMNLIAETEEDNLGDKWQNYIIFKAPKASSVPYSLDQKRYGKWMHHSVKVAALGIMNAEWGFQELFEFLCTSRNYISPNNKNYAFKRKTEAQTLFFKPYDVMADFYKNFTVDGKTCIEENNLPEGESRKLIHIGKIEEEEVELSKITLFDPPITCYEHKTFGFLEHTDTKVAERIMGHVENNLYPDALDENDPKMLIKELGRIFWWICQAKPLQFGDPSIAEMLIRTIWASKGFEQPAWKEGIIPWVEVSYEPDVERFAENFQRLFK